MSAVVIVLAVIGGLAVLLVLGMAVLAVKAADRRTHGKG